MEEVKSTNHKVGSISETVKELSNNLNPLIPVIRQILQKKTMVKALWRMTWNLPFLVRFIQTLIVQTYSMNQLLSQHLMTRTPHWQPNEARPVIRKLGPRMTIRMISNLKIIQLNCRGLKKTKLGVQSELKFNEPHSRLTEQNALEEKFNFQI